MSSEKAMVLVVADESPVRALLYVTLANAGYEVRSAEDGLSALITMRQEIPDIVLSDLNMPGMSGFELLSVVRRRFPAVAVIAMSGAFHGDDIPDGIAADAFYEKGTEVQSLLRIVETMTQQQRSRWFQHSRLAAPIWIPKNGHDSSGEAYVMIACPECYRTFPQVLDEEIRAIRNAECVFCHGVIPYAIVQPNAPILPPRANFGSPIGRKPSA